MLESSHTERLKALFTVASDYVCQPIKTLNAYLVRSVKAATLVCIALTPTACMPSWENPNMSAAAWQQTEADCALEAAYKVKPNYVNVLDAGSAFESTNCHKGNCSTLSTYTPPHVERIDLNEPLRKQVGDACLARNGGIQKIL